MVVHCHSQKRIHRKFIENPVATFSDFDSAIASGKEQVLFIVFNDGDSLAYNQPITKTLQFDTTRTDYVNYLSLSDYYAVVKLYRKDFNQLIKDPSKYEHIDILEERALECSQTEAFLFVTSPHTLTIYGSMDLDSPKEMVHDIIWVFMGP
jgi:hypothetical protein